MVKPPLMWVDLSGRCASEASRRIAADEFSIDVCSSIDEAFAEMRGGNPRVVCFEFEHPDLTQLRAMRDFKLANPSLPLLMLTTYHSEALAIWAFRVRVWNYLVKPVSASELRANFKTLAQVVRESRGPPRSVRSVGVMMPDDVGIMQVCARLSSLDAALKQIEERYPSKLRQTAIAAICGMSSSSFSRAFKKEYGLNFSDYLVRYRIGQACRLLRQRSHNATAAGLAVGFDDPSHFARAFRRLLGVSPSRFQREAEASLPLPERRRRPRGTPGGAVVRASRRRAPTPKSMHRIEAPSLVSPRADDADSLRIPPPQLLPVA